MADVMNLISEAGQAHKVITEQSRKLAGKWEKSGLLEGLKTYDKQGGLTKEQKDKLRAEKIKLEQDLFNGISKR